MNQISQPELGWTELTKPARQNFTKTLLCIDSRTFSSLQSLERRPYCKLNPFSPTTMSTQERSTTPPLNSGGSSKESLQPPVCRHRDRSPSPIRGFNIPSPLPTRRNRTCSAAARASEGPVFSGVCKCFSRSKGHGFIIPSDGGSEIFVHISDIEGEYVPVEGDEVSYKVCALPPKCEKVQAVEVTITHLKPGTKHETWTGNVVNS